MIMFTKFNIYKFQAIILGHYLESNISGERQVLIGIYRNFSKPPIELP